MEVRAQFPTEGEGEYWPQEWLGAIHQKRPVEGGGCANVDELERGGGEGVSHQPDIQKRKKVAFHESVLESDTPPSSPRPWASGLQYILRFGHFNSL